MSLSATVTTSSEVVTDPATRPRVVAAFDPITDDRPLTVGAHPIEPNTLRRSFVGPPISAWWPMPAGPEFGSVGVGSRDGIGCPRVWEPVHDPW